MFTRPYGSEMVNDISIANSRRTTTENSRIHPKLRIGRRVCFALTFSFSEAPLAPLLKSLIEAIVLYRAFAPLEKMLNLTQ